MRLTRNLSLSNLRHPPWQYMKLSGTWLESLLSKAEDDEGTEEEESILLRCLRKRGKRFAETQVVAPMLKRPRRAALAKKASTKKKLPLKVVNAETRPFIDHLVIDRGFLKSHKLKEVLGILNA